MNTYKIAAMVRHSGKHLETEVAAHDIRDAFHFFSAYLLKQDLCIAAICELDISEVVQ